MGLLDGRVVIVTGGGRGIGRSHCLELAAHGAKVVVNDLGVGLHGEDSAETPGEAVVNEIKELGGEAFADRTNVTDWDGVADLVARTVDTWGRLDAVVNNAGIVRDRMITSMSEQDWDAVIAVHLKGTFNITKHVCDHWRAVAKAGGSVSGRIVNTTSGTGLFGNVGQAAYGAAKAGIASLTTITAMEMARYGVTCNAISPLAFTRMTEGSVMSNREQSSGWDPMDPSASSPVAAWLCSEEAGWLSGAVLRVNGSTVARVNPWAIDATARVDSRSGERLTVEEIGPGLRRAYGVIPRGIGG
ncbi:SDR family NAD(P)-dependent oxidoreductase [Nocardia sp. BSTN01]|uniref:SDR family NAD(P)-dependent oxidoreductase n=1 Tax=Nocardia sp. BSTN01 TaxID=2783665 RepID=UPI00189038E1|nr:SDR family NAD(P)-dependent oxidoreductase [Nocardia sp. BSTN01]MBF4997352.1 SDR family NAD(P)-dependent oxidoreductase [Nocardia sp. BSTN01]